ncbi:glycosyltransferase [Nocardioides marmoriginsengisoli]|uniref:Glycosyltransferase n=1 Tax=Nocardioides marmoriginsengisoli TaxID=661483 RepID=A0A3N0CD85_9ACTN|nr:glycosyltransferase [Nocardioides marmoriginsengisoli]RNL61201.1 glycosyltransferase [Nocardioides marmoriginsengisoli]
MSRSRLALPTDPAENLERRADYQRLIDGHHKTGPGERVVLAVSTLDLDLGRGDLYVAVGLGLELVERGYGVELLPRADWHLAGTADIFIAMMPDADASMAPAGSWKVAWVRNETERWAVQDRLRAFDQVVASSNLSLQRLKRISPSNTVGVLPIGVDTKLFSPPEPGTTRVPTAVTTAHFWGTERRAHKALMRLPADADVAMYGHAKKAPKTLLRWHRDPLPYFALPEIYRSCSFVIDDMNATTVGYGSLNSRLFESAACESLPLINGSLGVIELGFPEVPHYTGASSLAQLLTELRGDPAGVRARAEELGDFVRNEHSWGRRADQFVEIIAEGRATTSSLTYPMHFFPDYSGGNPYQAMLHARLDTVDAYAVPVVHLIGHLRRSIEGGRDPGVLSLHWTAPILQWARGPFRARLALDRLQVALDDFLDAGGRLIWTVHNVLPHDTSHRWAELELAQLLADRAEKIQVLSAATLDAVEGLYDLDPRKVVLIEHASYRGEYPDWITREAARKRLGLKEGERALIALGGIRPYKGLDNLVDVFDDLVAEDPTLRLLVAGQPVDVDAAADLEARCSDNPRVIAFFEEVPGDQLQVWMKAADLAVLPYRNILNSGAFLLAQTFGLPVVAPRSGALRAWEEEPHVQLFEPRDPSSLAAVIRSALDECVLRPEELRARALACAEERLPETMAARFAEEIQPLLRPR